MRAQHGHAHAGDADGDALVLKNPSALPDHLGLLLVVAGLGIDPGVVIEDVERIGMRQDFRLKGMAGKACARRFHELLHGNRAGAARRLIGRQDHALDAVVAVDRPQRHQRGDRRAIRHGDDALVVGDAAGVDLRRSPEAQSDPFERPMNCR
jgi:hypothetical protein